MNKLILTLSLCFSFIVLAQAQDNVIKTPQGISIKVVTNNQGNKIKLNDVITFDIVQKTDKDSVLFSSYKLGHPIKMQVRPSQNVGDLMDVFTRLAAKDSACVAIPSDSIFKGQESRRPTFLPKGCSVLVNLKVAKVQTQEEAINEIKTEETTAANKYIADNKLPLKTTPSGLKYLITQPSVKRKALAGDTLLVNYVGRTTNGKVFDSSIKTEAEKAGLNQPGRNYEPLQVVVGTGAVIKGWDEGLLLLNEGAKAKFVIPSNLAYGQSGAGADIPPYSTLIFDVEIVKIKPTKHTPAAPPAKKALPQKKKKPTSK